MKKEDILLALFLLSELQIHTQDKLLNKHRECEQRIEAHYPGLDKKNSDGSYTFSVSSSNTIIGPFANFSYESTAAFDEPGNLSRPLCEKTITISRSKITVKWHDAVMLSPETSDEPRWSADHSTYGYIMIKPQDPYKEVLGCKGGSRLIKNGGILVDVPDENQSSNIYRIGGSGNTVCKHSSRRIPIHVTGTDPFTLNTVGGSPDAAADGLSPYRFDHNQTITYTWDDIVSKNKFKSKEDLIRALLEYRVDGILVGENNDELSFGFKESDYINRILWKLFDYSEEKLKNEIALAEKAKREEIEQQEALKKAEEERQKQQMQADCQEAESARNKGEQLLNSNLQEAYQSFQTAIDKSTNAFGIATEFQDSLMQFKAYEIWTLASSRSVQCSYQLSLIDPQFTEIFQEKYAKASQTMEKKNYATLVSNIGVKAFLAEKYDDALAYLDKAIDLYRALDVKNCIPAATKAYCLSCMGKVDESYIEIEKVLATSPDEIYPNEIKGRILIKNGNKKQAKKWWEKTVLPMFHEKAYETRFYKMLKEEGIIK